jgi:uncharacterized membrane protein
MDEANLAQKTVRCLRALLDCATLGARHGPRLGMQVGAICGTVFPFVGNLAGAVLGALVGGPLGFLMGLVGGAVNRRWGWTLGAALPVLVVTGVALGNLLREPPRTEMGLLSAIGPLVYGALVATVAGVAGSRLGGALETSTERHFDAAFAAKQALATVPLALRLGVLFALLWTLADFVFNLTKLVR